jgi:hypothetical protein
MSRASTLKSVIALYLSTTFEGEKETARSKIELLAKQINLTFDEALAAYHYDIDGPARQETANEQWSRRWEAQSKKSAAAAAMSAKEEKRRNERYERDIQERNRRVALREEVLRRYGSEEAVMAPCAREQKLRAAIAQWRTVMNDGHAPPALEAIRNAYPFPDNFADALEEFNHWRKRDYDKALVQLRNPGEYEELHRVATDRWEMVRKLIEFDLPVRNVSDLSARAMFYRDRSKRGERDIDMASLNRIFSSIEVMAAESV